MSASHWKVKWSPALCSAQRIHTLSREELSVEEGSLYPALQKLLLKGWVNASPAISETGRAVREYKLTPVSILTCQATAT